MEINELELVIADQAIEIKELKQSLKEKCQSVMYWYEKCQGLENELKNEKETDTNENNE
jgi:uncharacterized coiled-coil protein SlyX